MDWITIMDSVDYFIERANSILLPCIIFPDCESLYSNSSEEAVFSESTILVTLTSSDAADIVS